MNIKHITLDVETYMPPASEGAQLQGPLRLVCLTYTDGDHPTRLVARDEAIRLFYAWLHDPNVRLSGHNVAFDLLACARAVYEEMGEDVTGGMFEAVKAGRISDTQVRAALLYIAGGGIPAAGLGLAACCKDLKIANIDEEKKVAWSWRRRYAELDGVPASEYPRAAADYAISDTTYTRQLWDKQLELAEEADLLAADGFFVQNERFQVAGALWCAMVGARGIRVDYDWACRMADEYNGREEEAARAMSATVDEDGNPCTPLLREDGTMDTAAKRALFLAAFESVNMDPILTPGGEVSCAQESLDLLVENDATTPMFQQLALYNQAQKFKSAYLAPILEAGALGLPLHHSLNSMVDSGRTSARGPNVQNFPARAKAKEKGRAITGDMIRGCFVPREGFVFVAADYTAIELGGLAQVIRNLSGEVDELGQAINADLDVHIVMGARMLGVEYAVAKEAYDWGEAWKTAGCPEPGPQASAPERAHHAALVKFYKEVKLARQFAKVLNYGAPGGCSANTLRVQGKQQGVIMTAHEADTAMRGWHKSWPAMKSVYFAHINRCEDVRTGMYVCEQHGPDRATTGWRRRVTDRYTSACNTFFQGIVADGAKAAGWRIAKACADRRSPLWGSAISLFVHDEFVLETPADMAADASAELVRLMVAGMQQFIPDILVKAEPTIYRERWSK